MTDEDNDNESSEEPVSKRVLDYLESVDSARPHQVANAIDASTRHTRRVMNDFHEDGVLDKQYGKPVIGHPMPDGGVEVLPTDKDALINVLRRYNRPELVQQAQDLAPQNIRTLIESELAIGDPFPLGTRKVSYSLAAD